MFSVFEKVAQMDPKHSDIVLLENYGAFQNRLVCYLSSVMHGMLAMSNIN